MFTGLVESLGRVASLAQGRLEIDVAEDAADPFQMGESVAVNGCCLTVVGHTPLKFDLSEETERRTALAKLVPGSRVNLERAMKPSDRLGGHIVQGHVDAVGELLSIQPTPQAHVFRFRVPSEYDRYLIDKGSVALDGISLTVVQPKDGEFDVWVIPHTLANTNLGEAKPGDRFNVEFDVVAKYVERLVRG